MSYNAFINTNEREVREDMEEDINVVLDEELSNCIQKLRNATLGYEVRTFITEYEELMFKKADMMIQAFARNNKPIQRTKSEVFVKYKRKIQHLIVLQIVQWISIILLAMSLIAQ